MEPSFKCPSGIKQGVGHFDGHVLVSALATENSPVIFSVWGRKAVKWEVSGSVRNNRVCAWCSVPASTICTLGTAPLFNSPIGHYICLWIRSPCWHYTLHSSGFGLFAAFHNNTLAAFVQYYVWGLCKRTCSNWWGFKSELHSRVCGRALLINLVGPW